MCGRIKQGEEKSNRKHNSFMATAQDMWVIFRMIISTHYPIAQGCSDFMHSGEPSMSFNIKLYMQVICNRTLKSQWRQTW